MQAATLVYEHAERGEQDATAPLCKFLSNKAAALLRTGCEREALESCKQVLIFDPLHGKALLRKAMANEALGRMEEALADCDKLLEREGRDSPLGMQCLEVRRCVDLPDFLCKTTLFPKKF
jgi:tetratricopeptide (TPR) repeat protein